MAVQAPVLQQDIFRRNFAFALGSDGAVIEPAGGTTRNFSTPQTYTVTSARGDIARLEAVS